MKTKILLTAISAALLTVGSASAATIDWTSTGTFNDESVLDLAGPPTNETYGVDFGAGQVVGTVTTANGYTFSPNYTGLGTTGGTIGTGPLNDSSITAGNYVFTFTQFGAGISPLSQGQSIVLGVPASATDPVFNGTATSNGIAGGIMNNSFFEGGGAALGEGELNNLTPNTAYTVEILVADNNNASDETRMIVADDGVGDTETSVQYAEDTATPAFMGAYILGTFTADSTVQVLDLSVISPNLFPQGGFIDQAILVTTGGGNDLTVPEPSAYLMVLVGLASLLGLQHLRRKSAGIEKVLSNSSAPLATH